MQPIIRESRSYPAPALQADPAWDEAFLRVESYLRAHQLKSRVRLNQRTSDILRKASERMLAYPDEAPVEAAMSVVRATISAWLAQIGNPGEWTDGRVRAEGRLALVLADFPAQWADFFLSPEPLPPGFATSLGLNAFEPGPPLCPRSMPTAELEFGLHKSEGPRVIWNRACQSLREAAGWLSLLGLFGVVWAILH